MVSCDKSICLVVNILQESAEGVGKANNFINYSDRCNQNGIFIEVLK